MIIDVYNHFMPKALLERLGDLLPGHPATKAFPRLETLWDEDARLRLLDEYDDYAQVLSLANPPIELMAPPEQSPALARLANDGLAQLCRRHPDRFPAFIAALPLNNVPAALAEIDRATGELGAKGIQVFTNVAGRPLSDPALRPIFARMQELDLPVWIHPIRGPNFPDYASEAQSENEIWFTFGWPYETTAAVTRLIYSGIFDELPRLKVITHHMGGMIPYYAGKIGLGFQQIFFGTRDSNPAASHLKRPLIDYYRMLYADTALNGDANATACGHAFFRTPHCLFASDAPFDPEGGRMLISGTMAAVAALAIPEDERRRIRAGNAAALLGLP